MLQFSAAEAQLSWQQQERLMARLEYERQGLHTLFELGSYTDPRSSINLPFDKNIPKQCKDLAKKHNPDIIIVIGIGGSNLGTLAVTEAVLGKLKNSFSKPEIYFADTVDPGNIGDIHAITRRALEEGKEVLVNCVTKSGNTTETAANFALFTKLLERHYSKKAKEHIVCTTDKDSSLWHLSQEKGFSLLEIPKKVGGRYSEFSAVGLFPLAVLGLDISSLLEGARDAAHRCLRKTKQNHAMISASIIYHHLKQGKNIHDTFFFDSDLESLGKWQRQLMGESLGKNEKGITPTVSIGTTDLHSVGQLYLGGPRDKITTFVTVEKDRRPLDIPQSEHYLVPKIEGMSFASLRAVIAKGVMASYKQRGLPFMHFSMPNHDAEHVGAFMQLKMFETIYLASLLGVNAFDQPDVERYKEAVRRILG